MKKPRVVTVSMQRKRVIAHVEAGPGDPNVSVEEYRKAEDERMMRELHAQILADFESEAGVTEH